MINVTLFRVEIMGEQGSFKRGPLPWSVWTEMEFEQAPSRGDDIIFTSDVRGLCQDVIGDVVKVGVVTLVPAEEVRHDLEAHGLPYRGGYSPITDSRHRVA